MLHRIIDKGEEQQTQQGIPGACPNAAFVHLTITGFDPESDSISFADPTGAAGMKAQKRIYERASAAPVPLAVEVAAGNTDSHRGRLPVLRRLRRPKRVGRPAAFLPRRQLAGARGLFAAPNHGIKIGHRAACQQRITATL